MATVTKRCCDVFETFKHVHSYRVIMLRTDGDGTPLDLSEDDAQKLSDMLDECHPLADMQRDLSDRALDRLRKALKKGTSPPSAEKNSSAEEDPNQQHLDLGDSPHPAPDPAPNKKTDKKKKKKSSKKAPQKRKM